MLLCYLSSRCCSLCWHLRHSAAALEHTPGDRGSQPDAEECDPVGLAPPRPPEKKTESERKKEKECLTSFLGTMHSWERERDSWGETMRWREKWQVIIKPSHLKLKPWENIRTFMRNSTAVQKQTYAFLALDCHWVWERADITLYKKNISQSLSVKMLLFMHAVYPSWSHLMSWHSAWDYIHTH